MTTVDRYVALSFLRSYLLLVSVGIGLYVTFDLLVNLDEFTKNPSMSFGQVLYTMCDYYVYNLPLYFSQLAGPVMAFASAYTFGMMLRNNELTALVAAGMPLQRLAAPVLVASALLIGAWLYNRDVVLPAFAPKIARQHDDLTGVRTAGITFARDDHDAILTARRINLPQGRLEYVVIAEPVESSGCLIQADAATWDVQRRTWRLESGKRIVPGAAGGADSPERDIQRQPINEYAFTLAPEELALRQSSEWAGMLSLREMNSLLKSRNLPNLAAVRMQRHIWLTSPLLQLLLVTLALPFFLRREPGSVLAAGGRALLLCGAFFATSFFVQNIVSDQWAAAVAWIPILVFAPVVVLQMANVRT